MTVKVYAYANCSTCRKALNFLSQHGVTPVVVDITETPPSKDELRSMLNQLDGQVRPLFNTSGQVYREMGLGKKLGELSEATALDLLASQGRLVKRPFLVIDGKARAVGFKAEEWSKFFALD